MNSFLGGLQKKLSKTPRSIRGGEGGVCNFSLSIHHALLLKVQKTFLGRVRTKVAQSDGHAKATRENEDHKKVPEKNTMENAMEKPRTSNEQTRHKQRNVFFSLLLFSSFFSDKL